jgi:hypothetical protein
MLCRCNALWHRSQNAGISGLFFLWVSVRGIAWRADKCSKISVADDVRIMVTSHSLCEEAFTMAFVERDSITFQQIRIHLL